MFKETTKQYEIILKKLLITSFEAKTYMEEHLHYTDFTSLYNLYFRIGFFLRELKDETSELTFYLLKHEKQEIIKDLHGAYEIVETHLQDTLFNTYSDLPIEKTITKAKAKVLSYQSQPNQSKSFNTKFFQSFYEELLELLTPITPPTIQHQNPLNDVI